MKEQHLCMTEVEPLRGRLRNARASCGWSRKWKEVSVKKEKESHQEGLWVPPSDRTGVVLEEEGMPESSLSSRTHRKHHVRTQ